MRILPALSLGLLGAAVLSAALLGETAGRAAAAVLPALLLLCAAAAGLPGLPRRAALLVPAGLLLGALALAAWRAPEPWAGRMALLEWGVGAALAAGMTGWGGRSAAARAGSAVAAAVAALSVYALYQRAWGLDLLEAACRRDPALAGVGPGASEVLQGLLASRLGAREPFGTFALSNTLAGLMLLGVPLLAGLGMDRLREGRGAAGRILLAFAASALAVLVLTGSRGAWLSAAAVSLAWSLPRAPRRIAFGIAAAVVLALGWRLTKAEGMGRSASFRLGYWAAAGNLVLERPWGGAGLGGFEAQYGRVRPVWARDARRAHAEPLQLWAEAGIWAAAGALWLGWACWRRGWEADGSSGPPLSAAWALAAGGLTLGILLGVPGILPAELFGGMAGRTLTALAMALAAGLAAWAGEGWGERARKGALAGTAALAVHTCGDIDLSVTGAALAFWAVLGALAAGSPGAGPGPSRPLSGLALALASLLFLKAAGGWIEAEGSVDAARNALLRRPGPLREGEYRALRSAALHAPPRAEAWALLGEAEERRWRGGEADGFSRSLGARARAAALFPSGSSAREALARLCLEGADRDPRLAGEALRWIDAAAEASPTAPLLRVRAAQVRRELRGVGALAAAAGKGLEELRLEIDRLYAEALDLDARVEEPNLKLREAERREAEAWLRRP